MLKVCVSYKGILIIHDPLAPQDPGPDPDPDPLLDVGLAAASTVHVGGAGVLASLGIASIVLPVT